MSQAEALLNTVVEGTSPEDVMLGGESHIIVGIDRFVKVPDVLKRIAVQFDHNIETVTFDCPRYWDEHDMSSMQVYINYMRSDRVIGSYLVGDITIDETDDTIMHFDWTISQNVTKVEGQLSFLICIKDVDVDGEEKTHWNSELNQEMYISKGLEAEEIIVDLHPDIISSVLARMDMVEELVSPEVLNGYINDYLRYNNDAIQAILGPIMTPNAMQGYVDVYMDENPPNLDTTLTKSGYSADAKAVGDAVSEVRGIAQDNANKVQWLMNDTYTKDKTLTSSVKSLFGLSDTAVPNDVFNFLGKFNTHWWRVVEGSNVFYTYSESETAYPKSGTQGGVSYQYLGVPFTNFVDAPRKAAGTYVGTGGYGGDNTSSSEWCELHFDFEPLFIIVAGSMDFGIVVCNPGRRGVTIRMSGTLEAYQIVTSDDTGGGVVKWKYSSARGQLNEDGREYYYIAIG